MKIEPDIEACYRELRMGMSLGCDAVNFRRPRSVQRLYYNIYKHIIIRKRILAKHELVINWC